MASRLVFALVLLTSTVASDDFNEILNVLVDLRDFEEYYDSKFEPTTVNNMYPILRNLFDLDDVLSQTETAKGIKMDKLFEDGKYVHQRDKPFEAVSKEIENEILYNEENINLQNLKVYNDDNRALLNGTEKEVKYDLNNYEDVNRNESNVNAYEVHENVVDTVDNRTPPAAIVGYTRPVQLNTVKPIIMNTTSIDSFDNNTISYDTVNNSRQDNISILHMDAEIANSIKLNNETNTGVIKEIISSIKSYFMGLQKGLTDKIHEFFYDKNMTGGIPRKYHVRHLMGDKYKNYSDVDKTDYYVRQRHISLT